MATAVVSEDVVGTTTANEVAGTPCHRTLIHSSSCCSQSGQRIVSVSNLPNIAQVLHDRPGAISIYAELHSAKLSYTWFWVRLPRVAEMSAHALLTLRITKIVLSSLVV